MNKKTISAAAIAIGISAGINANASINKANLEGAFAITEVTSVHTGPAQAEDHQCGEGKCGDDHKCGEGKCGDDHE